MAATVRIVADTTIIPSYLPCDGSIHPHPIHGSLGSKNSEKTE